MNNSSSEPMHYRVSGQDVIFNPENTDEKVVAETGAVRLDEMA